VGCDCGGEEEGHCFRRGTFGWWRHLEGLEVLHQAAVEGVAGLLNADGLFGGGRGCSTEWRDGGGPGGGSGRRCGGGRRRSGSCGCGRWYGGGSGGGGGGGRQSSGGLGQLWKESAQASLRGLTQVEWLALSQVTDSLLSPLLFLCVVLLLLGLGRGCRGCLGTGGGKLLGGRCFGRNCYSLGLLRVPLDAGQRVRHLVALALRVGGREPSWLAAVGYVVLGHAAFHHPRFRYGLAVELDRDHPARTLCGQ
jgi:hypothetical protein